jgi:hypothetical protein
MMSPDMVSQMGAMVARTILTVIALVASLTGIILFVETLRRWRIWKPKPSDSDRAPEMPPAVKTAPMSFESARGRKVFGWHPHARVHRLNSNRAGVRPGLPR